MVNDIKKALEEENIHHQSYLVIVTRGHRHDEKALQAVIESDANYIGMIGSKKKVKTVFNNLKEKGTNPELLNRVFAPIGLDLGSKTPAEIAISIIAQIVQVQNKGRGR